MASWIELYQNIPFILYTGDGAKYTPIMRNANLSTEFNISSFVFRNVKGTLIDKRNPMGNVYDLNLIFQGDDHVDVSTAFRKSANNRNPWTIQHTLYGRLTVQAISPIRYDNSDATLNITYITVTVQETIQKSKITFIESIPDNIFANQEIISDTLTENYIANVPPQISDVNEMGKLAKLYNTAVSTYITSQKDLANYINQYNKTFAAIEQAFSQAGTAISNLQTLLGLPAKLAENVAARMNLLVNQFTAIVGEIGNITIPSLKYLWQNNTGDIINSMCLAATLNVTSDDYQYNSDVLSVISTIVTSYNTYLSNLELLQTPNGGELDSFVGDAESLIMLDNQVNTTIVYLFTVANAAKQQRTVTLTKDSNWIYIAYQLYGLLPDDSTIERIIADNNAGPDEMIQVKKGRVITYYI